MENLQPDRQARIFTIRTYKCQCKFSSAGPIWQLNGKPWEPLHFEATTVWLWIHWLKLYEHRKVHRKEIVHGIHKECKGFIFLHLHQDTLLWPLPFCSHAILCWNYHLHILNQNICSLRSTMMICIFWKWTHKTQVYLLDTLALLDICYCETRLIYFTCASLVSN